MYSNIDTLGDVLATASKIEGKGIYFSHHRDNAIFLSYKQLWHDANQLARTWRNLGVKPKQKIVFQLEDNKNFVTAFWASIIGDFIPVPVAYGNTDAHFKKLDAIFSVLEESWTVTDSSSETTLFGKNQQSKLLSVDIDSDKTLPKIHTPNTTSNDLAFIQFSSGSTGLPKGVMLSHKNIITNNIATIEATETTQADTTFSWMPLTHDMGLIGFHINPMMVGCDQYIMPTASFIRDPLSWIRNVSDAKATVLSSPNFGYHHLLKRLENSKKTPNWELNNVRLIFNGAEPINVDLCNAFLDKLSAFNLKSNVMFPVYGLAEATLGVTFPKAGKTLQSITLDRATLHIGTKAQEDNNGASFVALGSPIPGMEIRIVKGSEQCGELTVGDIHIKGDSVTRGYFNAPEKTAETISEDGWLATGDLGFIKDGELYVTGRSKDLIIINGQNIYPHDLEQSLAISELAPLGSVAVVSITPSEETAMPKLAVFVQYRGSLEAFLTVKTHIESTLSAEHGIFPDLVIPIKLIPKTTSGKLQRFQLKQRAEKGEFEQITSDIRNLVSEKRNDSPLTNTEKRLSDLWQEVLRCASVSKSDNFFAKGGNSLDAVFLLQRISHTFGIEVPQSDLHSYLTLETMAKAIDDTALQKDAAAPAPLFVQETQGAYALTKAQLAMFALCQRDTHTAYNITAAVSIESIVNRSVITASAESVFSNHHQVLGAKIEVLDGQPQWVCGVKNTLHAIGQEIEFREDTPLETQLENVAEPFSILDERLVRLYFGYHLGKTVLIIDCHHLLCDGLSLPNLFDEWVSTICGQTKPNSQSTNAFVHYARYQSETNPNKLNYWKASTKVRPEDLVWPLQSKRPAKQDFQGFAALSSFNKADTKKFEKLGAKSGTSLQNLLQNMFQIWVSKHCGQTQFSLGIPATQRTPSSILLPGMFVDSLLVDAHVDYSLSAEENLRALELHIKARHDNLIPLSEVVSLSESPTSQSRNALFDVMFVYQPIPKQFIDKGYEHIPLHNGGAKVDVTLFVQHQAGKGLQLMLEGSRSLFSHDALSVMLNDFVATLNLLADQSGRELSAVLFDSLNIAPVSENTRDYDKSQTISSLLDDCANAYPGTIALVNGGSFWTYEDVYETSHQISNSLSAKGVKRGQIVAVIGSRSAQLLPLLTGINRLGACYVPIDDSLPLRRKEKILKAASPSLVVTDTPPNENLYDNLLEQFQHCTTSELVADVSASTSAHVESQAMPDDLAYIIFTSGSTGEPKGVTVTNQGLANYLQFAKRYNSAMPMNMALFTSISFDLTVTTLFAPLCTAGQLVLSASDSLYDQLAAVLSDSTINTLKLTPAHLDVLTTLAEQAATPTEHLTCFIVGGEQLSTTLAQRAQAIFKNAKIINEYGPTETVVGCITHTYHAIDNSYHAVPIGEAADNVSIYLLDKAGNQVENGKSGEIWIGGDGVSPGYFNDTQKTASAFIQPQFTCQGKLYRTGDIAYQNSRNELVYVGREGNQVQLRGYRIETEEVESLLLQTKDVITACVRVCNLAETPQLVAFYTADQDLNSLLAPLYDELPDYMVPQCAIRVERMPLTANGKIDNNALELIAQQYNESHLTSIDETAFDEKETALKHAWEQVLSHNAISLNSDFFRAGGDSIKALQIVAHLRSAGWELDTREILVNPTFHSMAAKLKVLASERHYSQETLNGDVALTPAMQWFFNQQFVKPEHYHQSVLLDVPISLTPDLLEKALKHILLHHDALRLRFDRGSAQYQHPETIDKFHLSVASESAQNTLVTIGETAKRDFSFDDDWLFKAVYVKSSQPKLLLIAHHLIIDGVSWRIVLEDLSLAVNSLLNQADISLPLKSASLHDYQALLAASLKATSETDKQYWEAATAYPLNIENPPISDKPATQTQKLTIPSDTLKELDGDIHGVFNTQKQDLLLASLAMALKPLTSQRRFSIEVESHGRELEGIDLSRSVGWFTAIYPVLFSTIDDANAVIRDAKEGTRNAPHSGLTYLAREVQQQSSGIPACRFNYLGTLNISAESENVSLNFAPTGVDSDEQNGTTALFECDCWIEDNGLVLQVKTACSNHSPHGEALLKQWAHELDLLITHLKQASDIHFTPSDFGDAELSQEDLDALF